MIVNATDFCRPCHKTVTLLKYCSVICVLTLCILGVISFQNIKTNDPKNPPSPINKELIRFIRDPVSIEYTPPKGEVPKKRFPQAVIIGFPKCGTRALLKFLGFHPYVVFHHKEVHFYDQDSIFKKGYNWYLEEMPLSYSDQITMEKTPAYVRSERAVSELKRKFPKIKLIALVRDPIDRLLSQDIQFETSHNFSVPLTYRFLRPNGSLNEEHQIVRMGVYYDLLMPWFKAFPKNQILVLDAENLIADPLKVTKRTEKFLGLPRLFSEKNFVYSKEKGFYCLVTFGRNSTTICLGDSKGRKHRYLSQHHQRLLGNYYRTYNEKLFKLIGERYNWTKCNI